MQQQPPKLPQQHTHHPGETAQADCDKHAAPADEKLLDDALKETFPASDPISPSTAAADQQIPAAPMAPPPPPCDEPIPFPTAKNVAEAAAEESRQSDA